MTISEEFFRLKVLEVTNQYFVVHTEINSIIAKRLSNLQFRIKSVNWNYSDLLLAIKNFKDGHKNLGGHESRKHQLYSIYVVSFKFDNLIFNILSLFDYIANIVGLILLKNQNKNYKWNSIVKASEIEKIAPTVRDCLLDHNKNFVNKLIEFRSDVIHREPNTPSSKSFEGVKNEGSALEFYLPNKLRAKLNIFNSDSDYTLSKAAQIVISEVNCISQDIFNKLTDKRQ